MLIPNISGNPVPAPQATSGQAGSPAVAVSATQTGSAPVELPLTAVPPATAAEPPQPSSSQLQQVVNSINQALQQANTGVEFSIDSSSGKAVVQVVDTATGKTIKQIPSKEMIAIGESIGQFQKGSLLSQKA